MSSKTNGTENVFRYATLVAVAKAAATNHVHRPDVADLGDDGVEGSGEALTGRQRNVFSRGGELNSRGRAAAAVGKQNGRAVTGAAA